VLVGFGRNIFLSVAVFVPIGRRWLETEEAPARRTLLAGLFQFGKAFCK
jgi:hypothetical protein